MAVDSNAWAQAKVRAVLGRALQCLAKQFLDMAEAL